METVIEMIMETTTRRVIDMEAKTVMGMDQEEEIGKKSLNVNVGGVVPPTRECIYQDFLKCQPPISNCLPRYQVKYASCTLQNGALTWWKSHMRTVGTHAAYAMLWKALTKLMTKVFQELVLLCTEMVLEEEDRVEKFIRGLLDNIQGNVIVAEPTRL
ncbi:hypothetical protein Tco_0422056 [Tanacetum coccineum]